jgi:two-component system cell cycle sensor histidine kinase/response regulator CckA
MLRRVIGEEVDLQVELHSGSLPVRIDPVQFEQVILNLVINARDAMNNRGTIHVATSRVELDEPRIKCEHELPAGSYAKISCRDTGTGISDSVVERIFEPFFTTKEVGKGTGLGLSTSYGIICQFQGSIEVDSQPGQGATFTVWLPLCLDEPDELIPADRWFGSSDDRHCTDPGFYGEDYNHGRV